MRAHAQCGPKLPYGLMNEETGRERQSDSRALRPRHCPASSLPGLAGSKRIYFRRDIGKIRGIACGYAGDARPLDNSRMIDIGVNFHSSQLKGLGPELL